MTVSIKVRTAIERSSWIRRMFEEGAALIAVDQDHRSIIVCIGRRIYDLSPINHDCM